MNQNSPNSWICLKSRALKVRVCFVRGKVFWFFLNLLRKSPQCFLRTREQNCQWDCERLAQSCSHLQTSSNLSCFHSLNLLLTCSNAFRQFPLRDSVL